MNSEKLKSTTRSLENWINDQRNIAMQSGHSCNILINASNKQITSEKAFSGSPTGCASTSQSPSTFDFGDSFGADTSKLVITMSPSPSQGATKSGVTFSYRGFSENLNLQTNDQLLIRLSLSGVPTDRCIKIVSPIGLIRDGHAKNAASDCKFDGAF